MLASPFWQEKQPPAVLKHSALWRYLRVFATKTGSTARNRRVVYVDAFAGSGRYDDGDEASPLLAMRRKAELATYAVPIELDCLFIEKDRETYEALVEVVPREHAIHGPAENQLDRILRRAHGQPLFLFMDPFGQPIPYDDLCGQVLARPRGRGLATEVLLNFSITALQRNAGRLHQKAQRQHAHAVLHRFDRAMGDTWWHEKGTCLAQGSQADDREREEAERFIVHEYARRVCDATGYQPVIAPIWRHGWKQGRPFFYLVLFTANPEGLWFYADALASAMSDYYAATHAEQEDLFDRPRERAARAVEVIASNVRGLVRDAGAFTVRDRTLEVLMGVLGDGGRNEVAKAIRGLAEHEEIVVDGRATASQVHQARILRGPATSLFT